MDAATHSLQTYRELAEHYERIGQTTMRDRFLMLAADAAMQMEQPDEAERLRMQLLAGSRHHMLRPYASWSEAAAGPDVMAYLRDLRLNYPPDVAEQMLASLKEAEGPPLDQTAPPPRQPQRSAIPMTAPVVDMAETTPRARLAYPMPETYPLAETPQAAPARQVPIASPARPVAPKPTAPPRPEPLPAPTRKGGSLVAAFLLGVTALGAAVVAAYALGRPFIPPSWLGP